MEWEEPHWSGRPREEFEPRRKLKPNGFAKAARFSVANRHVIVGLYLLAALLCAGFAGVTMSITVAPFAGITGAEIKKLGEHVRAAAARIEATRYTE